VRVYVGLDWIRSDDDDDVYNVVVATWHIWKWSRYSTMPSRRGRNREAERKTCYRRSLIPRTSKLNMVLIFIYAYYQG